MSAELWKLCMTESSTKLILYNSKFAKRKIWKKKSTKNPLKSKLIIILLKNENLIAVTIKRNGLYLLNFL